MQCISNFHTSNQSAGQAELIKEVIRPEADKVDFKANDKVDFKVQFSIWLLILKEYV